MTIPRGSPGSQPLWIGTAKSRWAIPMVVGFAVLGAGLAEAGQPLWGAFTAVIGLLGLWFTSVRVEVDHGEIRVHFGRMPWPITRYPMTRVQRASAIHVSPARWGGWGYRGKWGSGWALLLRGGPGIELVLRGDRRRVITVDDAETGADLINRLSGSAVAS